MPSELSTCLIHMTYAFVPLACRYPIWKLIPAWFLWEKLSYSEPSRLQEQGLQQEHLQVQGQGLLQV